MSNKAGVKTSEFWLVAISAAGLFLSYLAAMLKGDQGAASSLAGVVSGVLPIIWAVLRTWLKSALGSDPGPMVAPSQPTDALPDSSAFPS